MPRFAANLSMVPGGTDTDMLFGELPFAERFAAAAEAGFGGVEVLFPYGLDVPDLAARLVGNGLELVMFNLPPGDWKAGERGLASLPGRQAAFRDGVRRAADIAGELGCRRVHAMAGAPPDGFERPRCHAVYLENLAFAAEELAAVDVRLMIEPISEATRPGFFLTRTEQAIAVLDAVGHPNLWLLYDVFHAWTTGDDPLATLAADWPRVAHIQIAGAPGRHEPDVGDLDPGPLLAAIDAAGYDGWVGCEYHPRAETRAGLAWAARYGLDARA